MYHCPPLDPPLADSDATGKGNVDSRFDSIEHLSPHPQDNPSASGRARFCNKNFFRKSFFAPQVPAPPPPEDIYRTAPEPRLPVVHSTQTQLKIFTLCCKCEICILFFYQIFFQNCAPKPKFNPRTKDRPPSQRQFAIALNRPLPGIDRDWDQASIIPSACQKNRFFAKFSSLKFGLFWQKTIFRNLEVYSTPLAPKAPEKYCFEVENFNKIVIFDTPNFHFSK